MGLFSKLKKVVKNVFKGVKNVVSKIAKSPIGKALLIGAAVYVGYGLATQGTGFLSMGGAATSTAAAAPAVETAAAAAAPAAEVAAGTAAAAPAATGGALSMATQSAAATGAAAVLPSAAPAAAAPAITPPVPIVPPTPAGPLAGFGDWANKNPLLAYGLLQTGGGALASAFTPSASDEQIRVNQWNKDNSRIAGVNSNGAISGAINIAGRSY